MLSRKSGFVHMLRFFSPTLRMLTNSPDQESESEEKKWIQTCTICGYKAEITGKKEDESVIRASCLPCGHQGMFTLEEIEKKEE